jgi:excisionase family DNA binding protein
VRRVAIVMRQNAGVAYPNEVVLQMLDTVEALMTTEEVADLLQVPAATVKAWRAHGTGPRGHRVGRHIRYLRSDVLTWLEKRADPRPAA